MFRKGEKYVVRSHICDKKLQLEERKLVEQAKHIANPTEGKSQPAEIGLFDEMVLGIQNYYKIATCISLDCRKLHRRVMTVLTNRLNTESGCQLVREGGVMTESEKARFGASAMVRYVFGHKSSNLSDCFHQIQNGYRYQPCCVLLFHSWQEKDTRYAGSGHDTIFWTA